MDETTVVAPGINGKMSEVNAAFGLLQLKHMPQVMQRRTEIAAHYRQQLANVPGITCLPQGVQTVTNHSYFPILVGPAYPLSRDELYEHLKQNGIHARRYFYPLITDFPMYRGLPSAAPTHVATARHASEQVLCLPIYPALPSEAIEKIIRLVLST